MTPETPKRSRLRKRFSIAAAGLLAATAAGWYALEKLHTPIVPGGESSAGQGPWIAYDGPYRNIHPPVATVGSAKCAECHSAIAETYARHPMGTSIVPVSRTFAGETIPATVTALGATFRLDLAGDRLWCTEKRTAPDGEPLYEMKAEIAYAIGSGSKGRSFLTDRNGYVTQSPVSWYSQKRIWDSSPGFPPELHAGRPVGADCLYCHANEVVPVKGALNRFEPPLFRHECAIGCERCHGPGAEHVRVRETAAGADLPDYSIVNPARLPPALREAVCQQCHLEGEARVERLGRTPADYRPGLPLDSTVRVLVRDRGGDERRAVNHVEQMYLSKCFEKSGGALGCITCHDPHEKAPPEKRAAQYRTACLKCHECASPVEVRAKTGAQDNCIACHMPQFAAGEVVHSASTDHRIVRRREPAKPATASPKPGPRAVLFFPSLRPDPGNVADARDYAVGLVEMAIAGRASAAEVVREALPLLERAIATEAGDFRAWEAKSYALQFAGRKSEALAAARQVHALVPDYELGLTRAATLAADADQKDLAISYWQRAIAINPGSALYRQELARLLAKSGRWTEAQREAEEAIQLDPARATARAIVAMAEMKAGHRADAEKLFQQVVKLGPPNLNELRAWYEAEGGKR